MFGMFDLEFVESNLNIWKEKLGKRLLSNLMTIHSTHFSHKGFSVKGSSNKGPSDKRPSKKPFQSNGFPPVGFSVK